MKLRKKRIDKGTLGRGGTRKRHFKKNKKIKSSKHRYKKAKIKNKI